MWFSSILASFSSWLVWTLPVRKRPKAAFVMVWLTCTFRVVSNRWFDKEVRHSTSLNITVIIKRVKDYKWATAWQKLTKWPMRPEKSRITCPGLLESSLSAWRRLSTLAVLKAHSEDSDQTERMSRLIWVFAERTCHFVGFVMLWLQ